VADEHDATGTTDPTTGTTAQAADGSVVAADGSEVERLKAQLAESDRVKAQLLSEKTRYEEAQRELERYRTGSHQPSPGQGPDRTAEIAMGIQRAADDGDIAAQGIILIAQQTAERERNRDLYERKQRDEREMDAIPAVDRPEVGAEYASGMYASPAAAYNAVLGKRYRRDQETLAERRKREEDAVRRRADDVVDTTVRSASAAEVGSRTLKMSDYLSRLRSLPRADAIKLKQQSDSGLIRVVDD
jgi:hypothetical protein